MTRRQKLLAKRIADRAGVDVKDVDHFIRGRAPVGTRVEITKAILALNLREPAFATWMVPVGPTEVWA